MMNWTARTFEPLIGSAFQIMIADQSPLELRLSEVEDLTVADRLRADDIRPQPFSLIFLGPLTPVAQQACHDLTHPELGPHQIFLVPIGPNRAVPPQMQYQAIFN